MTPDPGRDVMVYQVAMVDALSGVSIGDRWTVWVGRESEGSFDSEAEAEADLDELVEFTLWTRDRRDRRKLDLKV